MTFSGHGGGKRAGCLRKTAVEREFADGGNALETVARNGADGGEDRKCDGEIVVAAFLGQVGGCEIYEGALRR